MESNKLYVRRLESDGQLIFIDTGWISRVKVNNKKDTIKFKINTGEFHGQYIIYNSSHQNGIREFINLIDYI